MRCRRHVQVVEVQDVRRDRPPRAFRHCEEIEIEASRVINRPQRGGLQGAFGECVSRMASGFDCPGPSNRFIDEALGRDNPIDDAHALGGAEVVDLSEQRHLVGR